MYDVFKGPISFDEESNEGSIPRLILNPYSWTKVIMIISLSWAIKKKKKKKQWCSYSSLFMVTLTFIDCNDGMLEM